MGPYPKSEKQNQYVIVVVDMLTKFVHAKATETQQSFVLVEFLKEIFMYTGVPKTVQSDQGRNLLSEEFEEFLGSKNIEHRYSSPYHPETNGQMERTNRTLGQTIRKLCDEEPEKWDEKLREAVFSVNSSVNRSTGKTPQELVFRYRPRAPVHNELGEAIRLSIPN